MEFWESLQYLTLHIKNCDDYFWFFWVIVGHCGLLWAIAFQMQSRYNTNNMIYNDTINTILTASWSEK